MHRGGAAAQARTRSKSAETTRRGGLNSRTSPGIAFAARRALRPRRLRLGAPGRVVTHPRARLHADEKSPCVRSRPSRFASWFRCWFVRAHISRRARGLTAEYGARSGNRRITQEEADPSTRKGIVPARLPRATVFSPVDNWRRGALLDYDAETLSRATSPCDPTSGNAAANACVRAARPAIQHLDPASSRRRRGRQQPRPWSRSASESLRLDPQ